MLRFLRIFVPVLIPALLPLSVRAQGPIAPPSPPAESNLNYPNSADGLQSQLQDVLAAAKANDVPKLESLIKQMEIPNFEEWFTKIYGEEKGERLAGAYMRNLASSESDIETLFTQLAGEDGEVTVQKLSDARAPGLDVRVIVAQPDPANPFLASWKIRDRIENLRINPIGSFVYLDGSFRRVRTFRFRAIHSTLTPVPGASQGDPPGEDADASDNPTAGGNDRGTYRPGAGGVGYPSCIYCPSPEFTKDARARHLEGLVALQVTVQPDGRATDIQVVKTIDPGLSQKAIEAVSAWRFKPARRSDGEPVPVRVPIEVNFRLLN